MAKFNVSAAVAAFRKADDAASRVATFARERARLDTFAALGGEKVVSHIGEIADAWFPKGTPSNNTQNSNLRKLLELHAVAPTLMEVAESVEPPAGVARSVNAWFWNMLTDAKKGTVHTKATFAAKLAGGKAAADTKAADPVEQRKALLKRWQKLVADAREEGWQLGDGTTPTLESVVYVGKPEPKPEPSIPGDDLASIKAQLAALMAKIG